jgi:hypothetical protein
MCYTQKAKLLYILSNDFHIPVRARYQSLKVLDLSCTDPLGQVTKLRVGECQMMSIEITSILVYQHTKDPTGTDRDEKALVGMDTNWHRCAHT